MTVIQNSIQYVVYWIKCNQKIVFIFQQQIYICNERASRKYIYSKAPIIWANVWEKVHEYLKNMDNTKYFISYIHRASQITFIHTADIYSGK
jgi:hypothetical protein